MGTWPPAAQVRGEGLSKEEQSVPRADHARVWCVPETDRRLVWLEPAKGETVEGRGCQTQELRERDVDFVSTKLWRASQDWRVTRTDLEL